MPIEPAPGARRGSGPREVFFLALATLLAGYWALNKPFAYLGVGAFYVSELVLLIGVGCLLLVAREDPRSLRRLTSPLSLALLAFAAWGAARTLPFLGAYGINALRDAVLWGYAAFALLVLLLLDGSHAGRLARLFRQLGAFLPAFFVAAFAAYWYLGWDMSHFNSDRPLLMLKAPDVGVALGAMAAARLLAPAADTARSRIAIEVAWWIPWWTALALYGAISRGALLAALLGLGLGLVLEMYLGRRRPTLLPILVGAGLLILLHASGLRLAIPDPTRIAEVSSLQYQRYAAGMLDMLGMLPDSPIAIEPENPAASELSATVARTETIHWRLDWWRTILGYTL
ncbi:MAG TPA: hypothetical protein VJ947_01670, partial [Pseudohaliea sp.]|nr:hypothetical protein [Pseudohaliea sp.]